MNIKNFNELVFVGFLAVFCGCNKNINQKKSFSSMAENYYKLSLLELEDKDSEQLVATKKSLDYLDEAIGNEERAEFYSMKATLLFNLGKNEDAKNLFEKALNFKGKEGISLTPKLRCETLNNYACLLAQIGKIDEAFLIWKDLENDKDYLTPEVAFFNQSKIFMGEKKYKQAKDKLLKAINLAPNYLDAHFYLASIGCFLKDFELAKKEAETVLFLEAEHEGAKKILEFLKTKS